MNFEVDNKKLKFEFCYTKLSFEVLRNFQAVTEAGQVSQELLQNIVNEICKRLLFFGGEAWLFSHVVLFFSSARFNPILDFLSTQKYK